LRKDEFASFYEKNNIKIAFKCVKDQFNFILVGFFLRAALMTYFKFRLRYTKSFNLARLYCFSKQKAKKKFFFV